MNPWKTFRVWFCVRDCYFIDVRARSAGEAEAKAAALYEAYGESVRHGFMLDLSEGGTEGWEAEEVAS